MHKIRMFLRVMMVPAMLIGCGPERESVPPDIAALRSMAVDGLEVTQDAVRLTAGRWEGPPDVEGGATRPSVQLIEDIIRTGDVTGDGAEDVIAFVAESGGGTGSILYLLLIERDGAGVKNTATVSIGDRAQIRSAEIDSGVVTVELVQHADTDPMCCPGDLVTRSWKWNDGRLEEVERVVEGRLGPEVIAGETWRLVAWNSQELLPDTISITITYNEGRFAGSAGCNRYFNAVTASDIPGDITVGIGGSTRMMCPPEIMVYEDRYLALLPKVTQLGFFNGRLFLGYLEEGSARILLYEREQ